MSLTDPIPPVPRAPAASDGDSDAAHPRRQRYGRRRGVVPVGDSFVARLGPSADEPFAAIDDPEDEETRQRPSPETPIEELRFVALDCETTGQSPHRLVELGAVAFTFNRHIMSFETLVHSNDRINPFARRIHGISPETLGGAPPVHRVLQRFRRFARGAVLVEHSADAFDTRLITRTLGESLDADNIDTSRLAAKLWELRDTIGLEKLCQELSVPHRRPHHALADAEATMGCFIELVKRGRESQGWQTLGDLLVDGQPPPPRYIDPESPPRDGDGQRRRRRGGRRHRREGPAAPSPTG
jgi:DNA polymerase III epsilon subunit-like protein